MDPYGLTSVIIFFIMNVTDNRQHAEAAGVLNAASDPVLAELRDNEDDSIYDDWPIETESDNG